MDVVADSISFPDNGVFLRCGFHGCTNFCISSLTSNLDYYGQTLQISKIIGVYMVSIYNVVLKEQSSR